MDINMRVFTYLLGGLSAVMLIGIFFTMRKNAHLQTEIKELHIKYEALDGLNTIILYDLDTSRDSVRLLEQRIMRLGRTSNP